ncbi:MAG: tRNA (guanosine(46)-N7)-methyltransferase TrmB [Acidobacteria bacterium]|nr:tRNA (guanosine(46)-N7)-methyltransferase TrmB [Acidobacteriota bacterium]
MPRVRVHQHVNPLSPFYRQEPVPLGYKGLFADTSKPLLLDIGCARGRFLLRMAEADPSRNYLGVEIREPLVAEANRLAEEAGLSNLHYSFCNAMLWLERLLEGLPEAILEVVTIQFPDPWFKKKHAKRRMVNPEMVETVASHLRQGGRVFVQTDIEFLAEEMFEHFRTSGKFIEQTTAENPFPIKTEREKAVEDKQLPVYRRLFVRK